MQFPVMYKHVLSRQNLYNVMLIGLEKYPSWVYEVQDNIVNAFLLGQDADKYIIY